LTENYTRGFNFDVKNREVSAFATLFATSPGQRAFEYTEKKQGYFTYELVEALKGAAADEKGEVTLAGLIKYLQREVPRRVQMDLGKQQRAPADGSAWKQGADPEIFVIRGGSWRSPAYDCRSASRIKLFFNSTLPYVGFRVALSVQ
jgi:hypothetical protein